MFELKPDSLEVVFDMKYKLKIKENPQGKNEKWNIDFQFLTK